MAKTVRGVLEEMYKEKEDTWAAACIKKGQLLFQEEAKEGDSQEEVFMARTGSTSVLQEGVTGRMMCFTMIGAWLVGTIPFWSGVASACKIIG